jgi:hypothetical protein
VVLSYKNKGTNLAGNILNFRIENFSQPTDSKFKPRASNPLNYSDRPKYNRPIYESRIQDKK